MADDDETDDAAPAGAPFTTTAVGPVTVSFGGVTLGSATGISEVVHDGMRFRLVPSGENGKGA